MNRLVRLKILIRLEDGKQQEFSLTGTVHNPEIKLPLVLFNIETAINNYRGSNLRAHADIESAE